MNQVPWYRDSALIRVWFRALLSVVLTVGGGLFLYRVAFAPADTLSKSAEVIVAFITGSVLTTIVQYYWGDTERPDNLSPGGGAQ